MGKIDPKQLLGLFSQDLTAEGGIRNDKDTLEKLSGYVVAVVLLSSRRTLCPACARRLLQATATGDCSRSLPFASLST